MKLAAALFAGGESRRMGQDKSRLSLHTRPLWEIQLNSLRQLDPAEIFVSARIDPTWRPPNVAFVPDAVPSRGPLSGLAATLARTSSDHLLALAIDMPFMDVSALRRLYRCVHCGCGVMPLLGNRFEPLAAIYPVEALSEFLLSLDGDDFSLQRVARRLIDAGKLRVIKVRPDEEHCYRNLNEPADLQANAELEARADRSDSRGLV